MRRVCLAAFVLCSVACSEPADSSTPPPLTDASVDGAGEATADTTVDTASDAPIDSRPGDSSTSEATDAAVDTSFIAFVGRGDGQIGAYTFEPATGALASIGSYSACSMPSFLAVDPSGRRLYSVCEGSSEVAAFSIAASGALSPMGKVSSAGGGPAWVSLDRSGKWVLVANYGGGTVAVLPTKPDGSLSTPPAATRGTGVNPHAFVVDASNQFAFIPNKGSDTVSQLLFDEKTGALTPNGSPSLGTVKGAGPRHLAMHPDGKHAYLMNELDSTMMALAFDATKGTLASVQTISTLPTGFDPTKNTGAEVAVSASGKFVYGSNRGHDSIVIFSVDAGGKLTPVGHEPTTGKTPRHFSIDPTGGYLLVGNQGSGTVVVFRIDAGSGKLTRLDTTTVGAAPYFVSVFAIPKK